jgi:uncharacterized protein YdhG (YjbR/CyaY superfamily)
MLRRGAASDAAGKPTRAGTTWEGETRFGGWRRVRTRKLKPVQTGDSSRTSQPVQTVDEYLSRLPEPARSTLQKVRASIRAVAPPGTMEVISYRIPAFKYEGMAIWYAAFSDHCSLFPTRSVIQKFEKQLKSYVWPRARCSFLLTSHCQRRCSRKLCRRVSQP